MKQVKSFDPESSRRKPNTSTHQLFPTRPFDPSPQFVPQIQADSEGDRSVFNTKAPNFSLGNSSTRTPAISGNISGNGGFQSQNILRKLSSEHGEPSLQRSVQPQSLAISTAPSSTVQRVLSQSVLRPLVIGLARNRPIMTATNKMFKQGFNSAQQQFGEGLNHGQQRLGESISYARQRMGEGVEHAQQQVGEGVNVMLQNVQVLAKENPEMVETVLDMGQSRLEQFAGRDGVNAFLACKAFSGKISREQLEEGFQEWTG
jgi:hypothetical protein